ncbi:uncharacterized protein [Lolium perenne]|uniref:uncharacterized protein n=1 Tax=Lolium perenne TaxID=4522 RepID=UPI003A9A431D
MREDDIERLAARGSTIRPLHQSTRRRRSRRRPARGQSPPCLCARGRQAPRRLRRPRARREPAPPPPRSRGRRNSADISRRRSRSKPGPLSSLLRAAAPGKLHAWCRRFRARGGSRRRNLPRAHLRRRRLRQGLLPLPCRWPPRQIAARGSSQRGSRRWTTCSRAGRLFWPLGPGGACRLQPGPEPAGLLLGLALAGPRRLRPEPAAGPPWWSWTRVRRGRPRRRRQLGRLGHPLRRSDAAAAADEGRANQAGAGEDEPARTEGADSHALVRTEGAAGPSEGLHVAKGARLVAVPSASDSSFGSAGTMERAWHQANSCEVLSREGQPGTAPMKMLFSGYRASLKTKAAETLAQLATLEDAEKTVEERRTFLYNQVVTSYHKAKIERAGLARELEAVKVEAAKVPQLESDLRAARAQCAESEEAGRSAAAKLKLAEQELTRLRLLEKNHITELNSLRTAEKEKVDDLSRRLSEVEKQRLVLQEEVTAKSTELTATAKRWTDDFSALDRGLTIY